MTGLTKAAPRAVAVTTGGWSTVAVRRALVWGQISTTSRSRTSCMEQNRHRHIKKNAVQQKLKKLTSIGKI